MVWAEGGRGEDRAVEESPEVREETVLVVRHVGEGVPVPAAEEQGELVLQPDLDVAATLVRVPADEDDVLVPEAVRVLRLPVRVDLNRGAMRLQKGEDLVLLRQRGQRLQPTVSGRHVWMCVAHRTLERTSPSIRFSMTSRFFSSSE